MVQQEKTSTPTNEPVADQATSPRRSPAASAAAAAAELQGAPGQSQAAAADAIPLENLVQQNRPQGFIGLEEEPAIVNCPDPKQSPVAPGSGPTTEGSSSLARYWITVWSQFVKSWRWYLAVLALDVVCYALWTWVNPGNADLYIGVAATTAFNSLFSLLVKRGCLNHLTEKHGWLQYEFSQHASKQSKFVRSKEDVRFEHQVVDPANIALSKQPPFLQRRMESLESESTADCSPEAPMDVDVDIHTHQKTPSSEGATGYSPGATGYSSGATGYSPTSATVYSFGASRYSPTGAEGHSSGATGYSPGAAVHSSGATGYSPGAARHSSGATGYSPGAARHSSGATGYSPDAAGHSSGATGYSPEADEKSSGAAKYSPGAGGHSPGDSGTA